MSGGGGVEPTKNSMTEGVCVCVCVGGEPTKNSMTEGVCVCGGGGTNKKQYDRRCVCVCVGGGGGTNKKQYDGRCVCVGGGGEPTKNSMTEAVCGGVSG